MRYIDVSVMVRVHLYHVWYVLANVMKCVMGCVWPGRVSSSYNDLILSWVYNTFSNDLAVIRDKHITIVYSYFSFSTALLLILKLQKLVTSSQNRYEIRPIWNIGE